VRETISTNSLKGVKWGVEHAKATAESKSFDTPCVLYDQEQVEVLPKFCLSERL
jgi:hypothetical protein